MHLRRGEATYDWRNSLGFLVNRLALIMRQTAQDKFREKGWPVTAEEWVLLNRLWEKDGQRPSDLADLMIRDRTTVTRLLDGMVRKGLVRRKSHPKDRRVVCTWLTAKGRRLQHELTPVALEFIGAAMSGIPASDLDVTRRTLRTVQRNIQALKGGKA